VQQVVIDGGVLIACLLFEIFITSIGWNLSIAPIFGLKQLGLIESFGLVVFIKTAGLQFFPPGKRHV
jgi:hypothetical protein